MLGGELRGVLAARSSCLGRSSPPRTVGRAECGAFAKEEVRGSSAVSAWIYARELEPMETEGGGDGDGAAPVRASSLVDFQAALLGLAVLRSPAPARRPQLGALLDPPPRSATHGCRSPLGCASARSLTTTSADCSTPSPPPTRRRPTPPSARSVGSGSKLTLLAWLAHSRLPHALVEPGASPPPTTSAPLPPLATVDRAGGKRRAPQPRHRRRCRRAAAGAAAVSQLVSWGARRSPRAAARSARRRVASPGGWRIGRARRDTSCKRVHSASSSSASLTPPPKSSPSLAKSQW